MVFDLDQIIVHMAQIFFFGHMAQIDWHVEKKLRKLPLKFIGEMSFVSHSNSFSATFVINLVSNYITLTISLLKQIKPYMQKVNLLRNS